MQPLGDMELDELERLWEEASPVEPMEYTKNNSQSDCDQEHINMSLFYGNNENDSVSMEY